MNRFHQIRLHVNDLVLPVPIGREEVLGAVGFEQDGAVGELGLFWTGAVPEGVGVPERDVGGVLDGTSAVVLGVSSRNQT